MTAHFSWTIFHGNRTFLRIIFSKIYLEADNIHKALSEVVTDPSNSFLETHNQRVVSSDFHKNSPFSRKLRHTRPSSLSKHECECVCVCV